jgi:hypothetical protein
MDNYTSNFEFNQPSASPNKTRDLILRRDDDNFTFEIKSRNGIQILFARRPITYEIVEKVDANGKLTITPESIESFFELPLSEENYFFANSYDGAIIYQFRDHNGDERLSSRSTLTPLNQTWRSGVPFSDIIAMIQQGPNPNQMWGTPLGENERARVWQIVHPWFNTGSISKHAGILLLTSTSVDGEVSVNVPRLSLDDMINRLLGGESVVVYNAHTKEPEVRLAPSSWIIRDEIYGREPSLHRAFGRVCEIVRREIRDYTNTLREAKNLPLINFKEEDEIVSSHRVRALIKSMMPALSEEQLSTIEPRVIAHHIMKVNFAADPESLQVIDHAHLTYSATLASFRHWILMRILDLFPEYTLDSIALIRETMNLPTEHLRTDLRPTLTRYGKREGNVLRWINSNEQKYINNYENGTSGLSMVKIMNDIYYLSNSEAYHTLYKFGQDVGIQPA